MPESRRSLRAVIPIARPLRAQHLAVASMSKFKTAATLFFATACLGWRCAWPRAALARGWLMSILHCGRISCEGLMSKSAWLITLAEGLKAIGYRSGRRRGRCLFCHSIIPYFGGLAKIPKFGFRHALSKHCFHEESKMRLRSPQHRRLRCRDRARRGQMT